MPDTDLDETETVAETETETGTGTDEAIVPVEPDPEPDHDAETLREIVARNRRVSEARAIWERLHQKTKAAKEVLEDEQAALNDFIAEIGREYPLFDRKPEPIASTSTNGEPAEPTEDTSWREISILELGCHGLTGAIAGKLAEAGIGTVGALADWTQPEPSGYTKALTDIPGIGQAKADKIADALERFWASRKATPADVNRELADGCNEAERAKAGEFDGSWRTRDIECLALAEWVEDTLKVAGLPEVGHLLTSYLADDPGDFGVRLGLESGDVAEIAEALQRFRGRLSNAQAADCDRVVRGG